MAKSYASSRNDYVQLQGSLRDGYVLHVQGQGPKVNRDYGVAVDIVVPAELYDWMKSVPTGQKTSLHPDSNKKYFYLQARVIGDSVHFQLPWFKFNREYGASFDVLVARALPLADFIEDSDECEY